MGSESQTPKNTSACRTTLQTWFTKHVPVISLAAVLVVLAIIRLRVADVPLERDEGEYAYAGQLILQGIPPYQLVYNMKFPGAYYAYSAILAIFGQTAWGIHAGLLVVNVSTIVILFFLARRLLGDSLAALVSAIAFGFLSIDRWIMGVFAHATHFVVLAAMAGLLVLLHALDSKKAVLFALAGVLLGASVLMKQNGIFFLGFGIAIAAWDARGAFGNFRAALFRASLVPVGAALPFAILCVVFLWQGVFEKFWFWTFQYAKEYVSQVSVSDGWRLFAPALANVTQSNLLIWLIAASGVILLWMTPWSAHDRVLLTTLLVTSFIAICPGFYFREHYFILLLPAVALFCGVAVFSLQRLVARAAAVAVFVIALTAYAANEWHYLFSMTPRELSRALYGIDPFVEAPEIAKYIEAHTSAVDRVAVLGSEPEIYFHANRKSATGYIYTYGLMEQQKYSQRMQEEMIAEVSAAHPKYVVYVGISKSWLKRKPREMILAWSEAYLTQCYSLVGIADIVSENQTRWMWDADAPGYKPESQNLVQTFKRKSDIPCVVSK